MEKILLLADALKFNTETLDFAAYIAKLGKSKIVGLFVESPALDTIPSVKTIAGTAYVEEIIESKEDQVKHADTIQKNLAAFKGGCIQREVMAVAHYDKGNPLDKVIEETRYADLLIADPAFSLAEEDGKVPSKFMMEILSKAECPVLIAPEYFDQLDEIVFAYDGSRSSVFAIKQFYYQLPGLADKRVVVLHINKESIKKNSEDNKHFKEWLEMHFSNVSFLELIGEAREVLFEYFISNEEQNKMLVTGAFGRNYLSTFFKPSTAELVLKAVDIPIFITHH